MVSLNQIDRKSGQRIKPMVLSPEEYQARYSSAFYRFVDPETGFSLNLAGFEALDKEFVDASQPRVDAALQMIQRIENGEIVNHTADAATSEDRAVDHYNLRMKESPVEGKSLADSLKLFDEINKVVTPIIEGKAKAPCGKAFTSVIFNGIGGSYLGPLMLVLSQYGEHYNKRDDIPVKLYFLANTDPETIHSLFNTVDIPTTLMVTISKSGTTQETAGNMEIWQNTLGGPAAAAPQSIAVTIPGSKLDKLARQDGWLAVFNMNIDTGGRTSVGSAVGGIVAAFAKIDFSAFLMGMSHMDELTRRADIHQNPAMMLSLAIEAQRLKTGARRNMIMLAYCDAMRELSHYLQQLYMESLGKAISIEAVPQPEGLTVFGGVGTGEQHAFMQQVQKGIDDAFVRFLNFRQRSADYEIKSAGSEGRQLLAFVKGTETALIGNGRSFCTSSFRSHDAFNVGMAVAFEERVVTILAAMRNLNAYDQPGVQDGKLAATAVNGISAKLQELVPPLKAKGVFVAADLAKQLNTNTDIVESILLDMAENGNIQGTGYACQLKATWCPEKVCWVFE